MNKRNLKATQNSTAVIEDVPLEVEVPDIIIVTESYIGYGKLITICKTWLYISL